MRNQRQEASMQRMRCYLEMVIRDDTLYIINNGRTFYNLNESGREQTVRILNLVILWEKWLFFKLKVTILIMLKQYQK